MKRLFFLLLISCLTVKAQEVPKHINTIIVSKVGFKQVVNQLLDNGYTLSKIDSNYQIATTDFKVDRVNTLLAVSINVRIRDSACTITGKYYSIVFDKNKSDDMKYVDIFSGKLPGFKYSFGQLDQLAKQLKGQEIIYKTDSTRRYKLF